MSKTLIVLEREFLTRVRSRGFVLSTVLIPLAMLIPVGIGYFAGGSDAREVRVAVVDRSPERVGARAIALARELDVAEGRRPLPLELVPGGPVSADSLDELLRSGELTAYLRVPEDVVASGRADFRTGGRAAGGLRTRVAAALSTAVHEERLAASGVGAPEAARLLRPVALRDAAVARASGGGDGDGAAEVVSMLSLLVVYVLLLLYGAQVLASVQEEKSNRIAEVLASTVKAREMLLGKIFGVGASALLQVSIWLAAAALLFSQRGPVAAMLGQPDLAELRLPPLDAEAATGLALTLVCGVLGFFLYAALYAVAGAAAGSMEDAQRFTLPLIIPLVIPVLLGPRLTDAPNGVLARALGLFPLTSPVVTPMRVLNGAPPLEVALAIALLAAGVVVCAALAGKVYRIGMLSTGKRPTLGELARWVRSAA